VEAPPRHEHISFENFDVKGSAGERQVISYGYSFSNRQAFRIRIVAVHGTGDLRRPELRTAIFHVGMCLIGWIAMVFPARLVVVRAGFLSEAQAAWWAVAFDHTLAEIFYLNPSLGPWPGFFRVECKAKCGLHARRLGAPLPLPRPGAGDLLGAEEKQVLVPMGGGKDSLTVWDLLARGRAPVSRQWFFLGMHQGEFAAGPYAALARESGASAAPIVLECDFAEQRDAAATWQVRLGRRPPCTDEMAPPWALLVGFASVLVTCAGQVAGGSGQCAPLYIAVGNEHSANEGNVEHNGITVNHQFDKGFAFERAFHHYVRAHISARVHYFSALQHLWEIAVAREFAAACGVGGHAGAARLPRERRYLGRFLSCNQPMEQRNCGGCAKCCFVFAMLSAFLEPEAAAQPFGGCPFAKPALFPIFEQLMGLRGHKPFECVGTAQEVLAALFLAREQHASAGVPLPQLFRDYAAHVASGEGFLHLLDEVASQHLCPAWFLPPSASAGASTGQRLQLLQRRGVRDGQRPEEACRCDSLEAEAQQRRKVGWSAQ
jgi:hypothetical protein